MLVLERDGGLDSCRFPVYDALGNMVLTIARTGTSETNPAYTSSNRRAFDVWGSVRASAELGTPTNKQRYCANLGHVEDDESGLTYMRARYYEPWTGRFLSEDESRDGANWFVYAENDPVGKVDFSGNFTLTELLQVIGNSLVLIGRIFLSGLPPGSWQEALSYGDNVAMNLLTDKADETVKAFVTLIQFVKELRSIFSSLKAEGFETDGRKALARKWLGYNLQIEGQILLTLAEMESPMNSGEWWGWSVTPFL